MSKKLLGCAFMVIVAFLVSGCAEDGTLRGMLVFDGQHTIAEGQVLQGDLVVLAGTAAVEAGATVEGSVWVLGGAFDLSGTITGDVNGMAGRLALTDKARVEGSVKLAGSLVDLSPGARVGGQVSETLTTAATPPRPLASRLLGAIQQALLTGLLGLVLGYWFATALSRVGAAAVKHPAVSLATGLLAGITGLVLLVLVGFTLILLPLALLLGLGAMLAVVVGWVGLGAWLAERLAPRGMSVPVAIALGSFVTAAVVQVGSLMPVAGAVIGLGAAFWGLGAVLLTRFGYQTFRPAVLPKVE